MIKDIKIRVPNIELFDLSSHKRRMKAGQFQANDVIELFLVFGARKEKIDTKERLADEFTRLDFIEATGDPAFSDMFYEVLGCLSQIDRAFGACETPGEGDKFRVGKDLFSSQPACVGFVTAMALEIMGRPGIDRPYEQQKRRLEALVRNYGNFLKKLEGLNSGELSSFLDFSTLNQLITDKKSGRAVGDFEREFFLKAFQTLIEEKFEVDDMTPCWRAY